MPDERPSRDQRLSWAPASNQCRTWAPGRAYNQVAPTRDGLQNAALSWQHVKGSKCGKGKRREADFFAEGILEALAWFLESKARAAVAASRGGLELEDGLQITRIAVLKALEGWRPEKSSFWTYCYLCVGSALRDELRKIRQRQTGLGPTLELADTIPGPPLATEEAIDLARAVDTLPEQQRQVILMRFGQVETLDATGKHLGLSRERARQIEAEALRSLRRVLGKDYPLLDACIKSSDACLDSSDAPDRDAPPESPA